MNLARHSELEEHIDLVARTMTDAHPSAGFRARVLTALPARPSHRFPRRAIPVATAMLIGTLAWLAGTATHRTAGPASDASVALAPAEPTNEQMASASSFLVPEVTRRHSSSPDVPVVPGPVFEPIQPSALSISPITMEPIAPPDPIALAPIDSRAGGR